MKIVLNIVFFVALCAMAAVAHANVTVDKVYKGGFTDPDVFVIQDESRGVVCYLFDGGNNVTSSCIPEKDLKKVVDTK